MKKFFNLSVHCLSLIVAFSLVIPQLSSPAFAQPNGPSQGGARSGTTCPVEQLGSAICNRVNSQQGRNNNQLQGLLNPSTAIQAVSALGGQSNSAAALTNQMRNIGIQDLAQDIFRFQLLSQLMGMIGGNGGDIGSMFQGLAANLVSGVLQDPGRYPDPTCEYDQRFCMAPIIGQLGFNSSIPGMSNFNNMGNVGQIAGQLFGNYNVGTGGNIGLNSLGGLTGMLGIGGGSNILSGLGGLGNLFGMFSGNNAGNGNWIGTLLTTIGALTGNSNLIMAGQVVNTLSAMNRQNQMGQNGQGGMPGQPGAGTGTTPGNQPGNVTPIAPGSDHDQQVGNLIVGSEGRRDSNGNIRLYDLPSNDGGGSHEYAGINSKYHPEALAHIQDLKNQGRHAEAEQYASSYIADYTNKYKPSSTNFANDPGVDYFVRDTTFNRGGGGASWIVREANKMPASNSTDYINNLRVTRERYEREVVGMRSNFAEGLTNRWNSTQTTALGLTAGAGGY